MRRIVVGLVLLTLWSPARGAPPSEADVVARLNDAVEKEWKRLSLTPEATADDAAFCRRVWLDLAGRVPPALKVREFLDSADPAKRARLVDALLQGEDFAEHWGRAWAMRLTGRRPISEGNYNVQVLADYLRQAFAGNRSYREVVQELISGEGLNDGSGPVNFLLRYEGKPVDLTGAVSKHFLGVTLQCAQCHDHPHAAWKKSDFWGVAAYFGRVRVLGGDQLTGVFDARRGDLQIPDPDAKPAADGTVPMKTLKPRPPGVKSATAPAGKLRSALAEWVTADANPYFARNAVNQVWAQLFGQALVGPLDYPELESQRLGRELLQLLAEDFKNTGYDQKRLIRILALSKPYQLSPGSADAAPGKVDAALEEASYRKVQALARFRVRPLSVDQLYQSIVQCSGHTGNEAAAEKPEQPTEADDSANDVAPNLLTERPFTVQRSLAMLNGDYIHKAVQVGARAALTANGQRVGANHIEWLFLSTVSRRPTPEESATMRELLAKGKGVRGLEDALWVLINSAEFNTNH
jgi:hypothetical protein